MLNSPHFLIDSHCHLDFPKLLEQQEAVLARMADAGVGLAVCIGVNLEDYPAVQALAERHPQLYASVGVHPEYTDCEEPTQAQLEALAAHPKVIAIGETGLDFYWHKDKPEWQKERFRTHIRAAKAVGKPLVIHTRDSAEETLEILREEQAQSIGGILHCFTGSLAIAEQAIELGLYISFSGIVTFKNAQEIKEVAKTIPLERILIETDAPYLAPVPHRGKTNEPSFVRFVAAEIAALRGISVEEVTRATAENFYRLFPVTRPQIQEL